MKLYSPDKIPLSYFYFGYKKAKHYVTKEATFCNYIDLYEFELELDKNLLELKYSFTTHEMDQAEIYWYPKAWDDNNKPQLRPKAVFRFKDQVVWATAMLVLGEWFDSNDEIKHFLPLEDKDKRDAIEWMVPWSFNNRIKRMHRFDEITNTYSREFIHFNGTRMYESFQWGLRKKNLKINENIDNLLDENTKVYMGETDIKNFYPTLKTNKIIKVINKRFEKLKNAKVMDDISFITWNNTINNLLKFKLGFPDMSFLSDDFLEDYLEDDLDYKLSDYDNNESKMKEIFNNYTRKDFIIEQIQKRLEGALPLDLIASGFLANCFLTEALDIPLQAHFHQGKMEQNTSINFIRYTDDITIISNNQELVIEAIDFIEGELEKNDLEISSDKTKPISTKKLEDKVLKELNLSEEDKKNSTIKTLINNYKKKLSQPTELKNTSILPGKTAVMEKLSQISDINLHILNNDELDEFLLEIIKLITTQYDEKEIKDDTKVSFSSWRIRNGVKEALFRSMSIDKYNIHDILTNAMIKYPYKTQLFEIMLLMCLDEIINKKSDESFEKLQSYLLTLNNMLTKSSWSSYGPYIRTHLLRVITREWRLITHDIRPRLKKIIHLNVQEWYADISDIMWHEKYSIYLCYSVCDIQNNPQFKTDRYTAHPYLKHTLEQLQKVYETRLNPKGINENMNSKAYIDETHNSEPLLLSNSIEKILSRSLHYDKTKKGRIFSNNDKLVYDSLWGALNKIVENIENPEKEHISTMLDLWNNLAKIKPESITKLGYATLTKLNEHKLDQVEGSKMAIHFSVLTSIIKRYFEDPRKMEVFSTWFKELNSPQNNRSEINIEESYSRKLSLDFLYNRMFHFALIQQHVLNENEHDFNFPINIKKLLELHGTTKLLNDYVIPIQDWIFYTKHVNERSTPSLKMLSEYEIVTIYKLLLQKETKRENTNHNLLLRYGFTINDWQSLRNSTSSSENKKANVMKTEKEVILDFEFIHHIKDEKQMKYVHAISLIGLLNGNFYNSFLLEPISIYKWKNIQTILHLTNYASTDLISIIVNSLNYHKQFYEEHYNISNQQSLPYKNVGSSTLREGISQEQVINDYLHNAKNNILRWSKADAYPFLEITKINIEDIID